MIDGRWAALEQPMKTAIGMAWEAYVGGTVGVGATLTGFVFTMMEER